MVESVMTLIERLREISDPSNEAEHIKIGVEALWQVFESFAEDAAKKCRHRTALCNDIYHPTDSLIEEAFLNRLKEEGFKAIVVKDDMRTIIISWENK